jgi:serralysin
MCALCGQDGKACAGFVATDAGVSLAVSAQAAAPPALDLDAIIEQLRTSWGGAAEGDTYPLRSANTQYAILTSAPLDSSPENPGWTAMTPLMAARAAEAFEAWDDLVPISLTPYAGNPPANAAVIQFGYSSTTDGDGTYEYGVYGYYQGANEYGGTEYGVARSEIWLNTSWSTHSTSSAINQPGYGYYGGYGFITYLHEIGHAMGLSHPGTYDASDGVVTYAADAEYLQDTRRYTVMSYFDADEDGSGTDHYGSTGSWRYAQTPMLDDVAAVQAIYGADMTTRAGDTVYGFHSTAGKDVYDFTRNTNPILTIWDGGGIDTLDLSGFGGGQYGGQSINLAPGSWSNVGGYMTNNLAIAFGAIIENAIGGSGNDTILGNSVANVLTGNAGNDWLDGGAGGDLLIGGSGNDVYVADDPVDQVVETAGTAGGNDTLYSSINMRLPANVENLFLTGSAIYAGGNEQPSAIHGNDQDNFIYADMDHIFDAGTGMHLLFGGEGSDSYLVSSFGDQVIERPGEGAHDVTMSAVNTQIAANVEALILIGQAVYAMGDAADNIIWGNDLGNGIYASMGNDELAGWGGADQFVFLPQAGANFGLGNTAIDDFHLSENDILAFDHSIFADFNDMVGDATVLDSGVGTSAVVLHAPHEATVTLWGVTLADVQTHQDHFYFI